MENINDKKEKEEIINKNEPEEIENIKSLSLSSGGQKVENEDIINIEEVCGGTQ